MSKSRREGEERRWWTRGWVPGGAELLVGGRRVGVYPLENLSAGGVLLGGVAGSLEPGAEVDLVLHLRRHPPVMLRAEVMRRQENAVAFAFSDASADVEDMIQDLVLGELERRVAVVADPGMAVTES